MNNLLTEFNASPFIFDRTVTDITALPFSFSQIEIQPNELAVARTFNLKMEKLYNNFLYLYGICHIANFEIPTTYTGWIGLTGSSNTLLHTKSLNVSNSISFNNGTGLVPTLYNTKVATSVTTTNNNLIISDGTDLTLLTITPNYNTTLISSQTLIDPVSGSLKFENISGLGVYSNELLFVVDKNLNNVYSYQLSQAIGDDFTRRGRLFVENAVGGYGSRYDRTRFDSPGKIVVAGEAVFIEDTGNKCFKAFDKNLNWKATSLSNTLFDQASSFAGLGYSSTTNQIFGVSKNKLFVLDIRNSVGLLSGVSYDLSGLLTGTDEIIGLQFAHYDPQIFYVLTKTKLIKKWVTKPNKNIGIYGNSGLGGFNFQWMTNAPISTSDQIYLYGANTPKTKEVIATFTDELNLVSLLPESYNIDVYTKQDTFIAPGEYNQSWVYNKSLKKMLYNLSLFASKIGYKFFLEIDDDSIITYNKRVHNDLLLKTDLIDVNTYALVCVNENFQAGVINRCLYKLYEFEEFLLTAVGNERDPDFLGPKFTVGPIGPISDIITYFEGPGDTIVPNPVSFQIGGGDGFVDAGGVNVDGTAPYEEGSGFTIE